MVFTKRVRDGVKRGRIKISVRIWQRPHVKAGGRYLIRFHYLRPGEWDSAKATV